MTDFSASSQYQATLAQLLEKLQSELSYPAVIAISGAQGSGKSTLAKALAERFNTSGITAAAVSLDDYYLSRAQRQQLAHDIHPLLAQRGVPGTHDIQQATADARAVLAGKPVALPRFDKALDETAAGIAAQQLDLLIVEGWCVGLQPQTAAELAVTVNDMEQTDDATGQFRHFVNQQLAGGYAEYWQLLKPIIWLRAPDWNSVCRWRARQEQQLWRSRGNGMTDAELARFMQPFQRLTGVSWRQLSAVAQYIVELNQQQHPRLLCC